HPGFIVYRNGPGPVWVCPHTGPTIEVSTSRDQWSDTIASQCWLKMGGTLIISTMPRKQMYGTDYNREQPSKSSSLNVWSDFVMDENKVKLYKYRNEYAWTSFNGVDHYNRQKIYNDFWRTVQRSGNIIVFAHSLFTRIKNFPSVMDFITYQGRGVKKELIDTIVKKTNENYEDFFKHMSKHYKNGIIHEHGRVVGRIKEIFSEFDMDKMKVEFKKNVQNDLIVIKKYADKKVYNRLEKNFNEKNYIAAIKSALRKDNVRPHITVESIFKGQKALKMKNHLFKKNSIVMEVETSNFFGYWYPKQASNIIMDILNDIVSIDKYRKMGTKQMDILNFMKKGELSGAKKISGK
ncbi:MAG: hypothetical protein KAS04_07285, partial [Candidatus Aenigmarchaeota archaeon]|nr:hypothetical protein [Candidatus Aenigmarchaeota archaeon]